jgi:O-antigen ligase
VFFFCSVALSGMYLAIYGTAQLLGYLPYHPYETAGFLNTGPYSGYLAIVGCICVAINLFRGQFVKNIDKNINRKESILTRSAITKFFYWLSVTSILIIFIALPAARSRASWLSIIIGVVFLALYKYNKFWISSAQKIMQSRIKLKFPLMLFTIIVGISILLYSLYIYKRASADGRGLIWKVTTNMIKERPLFGVGYDRFTAYYMNGQATYFDKPHSLDETYLAGNTYYAFNDVLQLIAENGIVGLIIFCIITIFCFGINVRNELEFLKYISLGVLLSIYMFGMFSYPMQILPIKMILVLMLAVLANLDLKKINLPTLRYQHQRHRLLATKVVIICIGIIIAGTAYSQVSISEKAFRNWQQALIEYNYGSYPESIIFFERAYPALKTDGDFLMNYGKALDLANDNKKAKAILIQSKFYLNNTITETSLGEVYKKLKQFKESEAEYKIATKMVPNQFYPMYLLAKLYDDTGQVEKAKYTAQEILIKPVKVPSKAIDEMKDQMKSIIVRQKIKLNMIQHD